MRLLNLFKTKIGRHSEEVFRRRFSLFARFKERFHVGRPPLNDNPTFFLKPIVNTASVFMTRIKNIIAVKTFSVVCEWTNGEIREIEFTAKLREWALEPGSVFKKLLDENVFLKVTLDTEMKTLVWENLLTMRDTSGNEISAPLDLCPDVLYEMSSLVETQFRKMA